MIRGNHTAREENATMVGILLMVIILMNIAGYSVGGCNMPFFI